MLWSANYEVGNALVDSEHKEIFRMVDRLLEDDFEGRSDKIKTVISFLADYVVRHFDHEEDLMDKSNYPKKDGHVKQHRDFVKKVGEFVAQIADGVDSIQLSLSVNEVIVDWLAEHVMISDKAMIEHYKVWAAKQR